MSVISIKYLSEHLRLGWVDVGYVNFGYVKLGLG